MPDIPDGETVEIQGSARLPYILKNSGGVYSCTCPAWRNQSIGIERRTCKHLRNYRGEQAETVRIGTALPARPEGRESESSNAPPLLLAHTWTNDVDLSGWWMSEKLDGVRAYWDGKQFLSRQGNLYHAPDWFLEKLPPIPLDGELWLDRKAFQRTVSIVRRQDKSDLWREISYVVFDAPGLAAAFEERLELLRDTVAASRIKHLQLLTQEQCRDTQHLREELARIEAFGGEGLMLRQPGSRYEVGRSTTLLKVKTFHDAEARVLEHLPGEGRHKGRLGALAVELPDGTKFSVGTGLSDAERNNPPPVGSVITFRYQELSDRGVPRFPSYVRIRRDADLPLLANTSSETTSTSSTVSTRDEPAQQPTNTVSQTISTNSTPTPTGTTMRRYYEFIEGNSAKFWEITVQENTCNVRYGKLNTNGQSQTKTFADHATALKHAEKLIGEKTGKGYRECVTK